MRRKLMKISIFLALFIVFLSFSNCSNMIGVPVKYTSIGNPKDPEQLSSYRMLKAVCALLESCNPGLAASNCQSGVLATSGIAQAMGLSGVYPTLQSVFDAELSGSVNGNGLPTNQCLSDISTLTCSNPLVKNAYVPSQTDAFAGVSQMLPSTAGSCASVYTPQPDLFKLSNISLPVGSSHFGPALADFDGDGHVDIALVDYTNNLLRLFAGDGTGGMAAGPTFSTGLQPDAVTTGDFDLNGKSDLVAANAGANTLSVFLNQGTLNFNSSTASVTDVLPNSIATGDFNGDGHTDLAITNFNTDDVSIALGNGAGGFTAGTPFSTGSSPVAVVVGDFNEDGKTDLVVAQYNLGSVGVFKGNGNGTFTSVGNFAAGTKPTALAAADINKDGHLDVVVGYAGQNQVSVMFGNGAGGFTVRSFTVASPAVGVAVGDINRDGFSDIVLVMPGAGVQVVYGDASFSFVMSDSYKLGGPLPRSVGITDLNSDGWPDIIAVGPDTLSLLVHQ